MVEDLRGTSLGSVSVSGGVSSISISGEVGSLLWTVVGVSSALLSSALFESPTDIALSNERVLEAGNLERSPFEDVSRRRLSSESELLMGCSFRGPLVDLCGLAACPLEKEPKSPEAEGAIDSESEPSLRGSLPPSESELEYVGSVFLAFFLGSLPPW